MTSTIVMISLFEAVVLLVFGLAQVKEGVSRGVWGEAQNWVGD